MTKQLPSEEVVATAFIAELRREMTENEFAEVVRLQKTNPISGVCHSHDYCDANDAMAAALMAFGVDMFSDDDKMSDAVASLWSRAWTKAHERMLTL